MRTRQTNRSRGLTLLEVIITMTVVGIMVAAAMPIARTVTQRQKEIDLRRALREIRQGVDAYKNACEARLISDLDRNVDDLCYPPTLEILVEGITPPNRTDKIRFLRRIPEDPMTGTTKWGKRSIQDEEDSSSWGGQNVFDVYSNVDGTALDGTRYKTW
ncbi:MAG: type II secretion system protein [Blastocatellia bacterium]